MPHPGREAARASVPGRAVLAGAACVAALGAWTCGGQSAYPAPSESAELGGEVVDATPDLPLDGRRDAELATTPDWDLSTFVEEGTPGLRLPLWDPSGRALEAFHAALRRAEAGDGKARLLFWGASHVASDWFTGVVREGLQARFGDGGHGFVMPVKPWRSYRHLGVSIDSDWRRWTAKRVRASDVEQDYYGLAGVYVEGSHDGGFGKVERTRGPAESFELWYLARPGGGDVDVFVGPRRVARIATDAESPRAGYEAVEVASGDQPFGIRLAGNGPVRLFGAVVERDAPGVVVDTLGINGSRARYQLLWEDATFRDHVRRRGPDLVVLAYGTNEAGDDQPLAIYERQLREVIGRLREAAPGASCVLIGPSDRPMRDPETGALVDRPRTGELVVIQREIAVESGCAFFDLVAFSGGPLSMVSWAALDPPYAQQDLVHYTRLGYERLGQVLLQALSNGYEGGSADPVSP